MGNGGEKETKKQPKNQDKSRTNDKFKWGLIYFGDPLTVSLVEIFYVP